jgi:membrane protease YdiL (CAAX protease family)
MIFTRYALALVITILLFAGVYVPAFIAASLFAPDEEAAVPWVVAVSLVAALLIMALLSRIAGYRFSAFGFGPPAVRDMLWGVGWGVVIGLVLRLGSALLEVSGPFSEESFSRWQIIALFWVAAPIQEEVIFRGLLQGTLEGRMRKTIALGGMRLSIAALIIAVLFAVVHLSVDPLVAVAALLLGLVAGHLRWRSGSLVPAVLVHALFNVIPNW